MSRTHERIKITHCMFDTSPSKRHCTEALRKNSGKKLEVSSQQSACQNSRNYRTGIRHQLDSVAHLVQWRLSIEEHKATELKLSMKLTLSHVTKLLTPHPVNAHNEEFCPLVYCIANQYAHPCCAWHSLLRDRTEICSTPVPANMRYCMGQLLSLVSRIPQIQKIGHTSFGISQVHDGNALRYTNFILFQIWITSDDGTSVKVNMFTHQVTTQTSPLRRARMAFTGYPNFCSA
jgi:hypothetical protein